MKLLPEVKAGATMSKQSNKTRKKSDMSIMNSITYKIYKYLINKASLKVKMPQFNEGG